MSEQQKKIPESLWKEFDKARESIKKVLLAETNKIAKGRKCHECVWGTKADRKKIFCPFPECVMENGRVG